MVVKSGGGAVDFFVLFGYSYKSRQEQIYKRVKVFLGGVPPKKINIILFEIQSTTYFKL